MSTLEFHPLADLFPLMEGAEFDALVADIKKNGLHYPIFLYEGKILDGRNRYRACLELGWEPATRNCDNHVGDPAGFVISRNIRRRHLTAAQKRDLIAKLLKAAPEKSNRQIAETAKADDKTVAAIRRGLESTAEIPQLEKTVGGDGKARKRPAKKPTRAPTARVSKPAPHQPAHISREDGERVGRFAYQLIQTDIDLARELVALLWAPLSVFGRI
jgi:hypothetical protein